MLEKLALLQVYVHIRTGKEITPRAPQDVNELMKMNKLHIIARDWLHANKVKITRL